MQTASDRSDGSDYEMCAGRTRTVFPKPLSYSFVERTRRKGWAPTVRHLEDDGKPLASLGSDKQFVSYDLVDPTLDLSALGPRPPRQTPPVHRSPPRRCSSRIGKSQVGNVVPVSVTRKHSIIERPMPNGRYPSDNGGINTSPLVTVFYTVEPSTATVACLPHHWNNRFRREAFSKGLFLWRRVSLGIMIKAH